MRYGVLADVHGNLPALQAVITELRRRGAERWIVAGDIVGYGAYPNECADLLAELDAVCVAGNHDLIAIGRLGDDRISAPARASLAWTSARLSPATHAFLADLPLAAAVDGDVVITHGSLGDAREYVARPGTARTALERLRHEFPSARVLVVGHTHHPWAWSVSRGGNRFPRLGMDVPRGEPMLLNPGAVGQSRELLARARGAILDLDLDRVEFAVVRYDTAAYRVTLREAGLPPEGYQYVPSRARAALRVVRVALAGY